MSLLGTCDDFPGIAGRRVRVRAGLGDIAINNEPHSTGMVTDLAVTIVPTVSASSRSWSYTTAARRILARWLRNIKMVGNISSKSKRSSAKMSLAPEDADALEFITTPPEAPITAKSRIRARVTEFAYPPVHDGVVIGRTAQLGLESFRKALDLLVSVPFYQVNVEDDIVGHILVRHAILRRIDEPKLLVFVLRRIKPLMSSEEILHLDLKIETEIDEDCA